MEYSFFFFLCDEKPCVFRHLRGEKKGGFILFICNEGQSNNVVSGQKQKRENAIGLFPI